jgi:hypothetical protein
MTQTQKWPEKMKKTREEMSALGLPGGRKEDGAKVVQDTIAEQGRWTTTHDLIFQLPDMPDDLAYRTYYRTGSTEQQDEAPWEYEPADCALVRRVPKVVDDWTDAPPNQIPDLRAATYRKIREFMPGKWGESRMSLLAAENMTPEWHQRLQDNAGKRVRVRRVTTYEGDNTAVLRALAMSLPVGKTFGGPGDYTTVVEEVEYGPVKPVPARIEVCRIDPDSIIGIAPCDDGDEGWVVLAVQPDPDSPAEIVAPVGDDVGPIVYTDILDAAEVLRTGIVWKHDMGEETTDDPDSGPLDDIADPPPYLPGSR